LFKSQLQRAGAHRLHGLGHQLHLAALLIYAHFSAHQHMQAVFRTEAEQHGLAPEQHHGQLRVGVLEREVEMTGRSGPEVGDFALDPDVAVFLLHKFANHTDQLAHRPDAARGLRLFKAEVQLGRRGIGSKHSLQSVIGGGLFNAGRRETGNQIVPVATRRRPRAQLYQGMFHRMGAGY